MKKLLIPIIAFALCVSTTVPVNAKIQANPGGRLSKMYELPEVEEATEDTEIVSSLKGTIDSAWWDKFSDRYFYNNMNSNEKAFYDKLDTCVRDMFFNEKDAVLANVSYQGDTYSVYETPLYASYEGLTRDMAERIYILYANANPQYYFLGGEFIIQGKKLYPLIYYNYGLAGQRAAANARFMSTVDSWVADVNSRPTVYEKVKRIYDLLAEKLSYTKNAWDLYQSTSSAILEGGSTVCAGYSESIAVLAKAIGLQCLVITSNDHEWDMIKLGDYWHYMDLTIDDVPGKPPRYDFFLKSENFFLLDGRHFPESQYITWGLPQAPYNYDNRPDGGMSATVITPDPQTQVQTQVQPETMPQTPVPSGGNGTETYRLRYPATGQYLYSATVKEINALTNQGWVNEGVCWNATSLAQIPVYRLRNAAAGIHMYTRDVNEVNIITQNGWINEGIAWYSDPYSLKPVYRLRYKDGRYLFSATENEKNSLVATGQWYDEGVGWYVTN